MRGRVGESGSRGQSGGNESMKKKIGSLASWEDVEAEIGEVAKLDLAIEAQENALNKRTQAIAEEAAPAIKELKEERAEREAAVLQFAKKHRRDFGDAKSRKFTFGTVSFSKVSKAVKFLIEEVKLIANLKRFGFAAGVVKDRGEVVDKNALAAAPIPEAKRESIGFTIEENGNEPKLTIDRKAIEAQLAARKRR